MPGAEPFSAWPSLRSITQSPSAHSSFVGPRVPVALLSLPATYTLPHRTPIPSTFQTQWLCQPPALGSRSPTVPPPSPLHSLKRMFTQDHCHAPTPTSVQLRQGWCPPSRLAPSYCSTPVSSVPAWLRAKVSPGVCSGWRSCAARPSNTMKHTHSCTRAPETLRQPCGPRPALGPVLPLDQLPPRGPVPRRGLTVWARAHTPCTSCLWGGG